MKWGLVVGGHLVGPSSWQCYTEDITCLEQLYYIVTAASSFGIVVSNTSLLFFCYIVFDINMNFEDVGMAC